jgi:hypothetical protein
MRPQASAWGWSGPNFEACVCSHVAMTDDRTAFQGRAACLGSLAPRNTSVRCFPPSGSIKSWMITHEQNWAGHDRGQDQPQRERNGDAEAVLLTAVLYPIAYGSVAGPCGPAKSRERLADCRGGTSPPDRGLGLNAIAAPRRKQPTPNRYQPADTASITPPATNRNCFLC